MILDTAVILLLYLVLLVYYVIVVLFPDVASSTAAHKKQPTYSMWIQRADSQYVTSVHLPPMKIVSGYQPSGI